MTRISQEDIPTKQFNSSHQPSKFSKSSSLQKLMKNKSPPTFRQGPGPVIRDFTTGTGPGMNAYSSPPQKLDDLNYAHKPDSIFSPSTDKKGAATGAGTGTGRSTNNSTGLGFILASPKGSTNNSSPTTARMRQ